MIVWILPKCSKPDPETKGLNQTPDFQADVFYPLDQPRFHLSEINQAKPVLLVFWATWCPSCKEEMPALNNLAALYEGKIAIVSVNAGEKAADIETFLVQNQIHFPVLLDESGELANLFEVSAIPSVLLLAKGGKILYYGFRLPDQEKLEAALTG